METTTTENNNSPWGLVSKIIGNINRQIRTIIWCSLFQIPFWTGILYNTKGYYDSVPQWVFFGTVICIILSVYPLLIICVEVGIFTLKNIHYIKILDSKIRATGFNSKLDDVNAIMLYSPHYGLFLSGFLMVICFLDSINNAKDIEYIRNEIINFCLTPMIIILVCMGYNLISDVFTAIKYYNTSKKDAQTNNHKE